MSTNDKLSVVIITFNEEKNIARCLNSVKEIADEIVILDSGSTDRTKEIANEYDKVKFYTHNFDGHIQQKNRAKNLATYDWVLSLDADEALDETLSENIRTLKGRWDKDGYYMNRLTNYCGHWVRHSNWYPDKKLRLWNRHKGEWRGINPHDKFEMFEGDKVTGYLKGNILHYSYYTLDDHYRQVEYFTNIASKAYFEKGIRAYYWNLLVNPVAKFIDHYILHLGFLDGKAGWNIAKISAYATYLKYKKIMALQNKEKL
ncbi:MAG: glycosyltransferase family 2 protein [Bacteroidia bacterium]